jgi:hypothetical protein
MRIAGPSRAMERAALWITLPACLPLVLRSDRQEGRQLMKSRAVTASEDEAPGEGLRVDLVDGVVRPTGPRAKIAVSDLSA